MYIPISKMQTLIYGISVLCSIVKLHCSLIKHFSTDISLETSKINTILNEYIIIIIIIVKHAMYLLEDAF